MDLLLDTRALLWALLDPDRLRQAARAAIVDPTNDVYVSAVSALEVAVKVRDGKLPVRADVGAWLPPEMEKNRFLSLAVTLKHAARVEHLPLHHRDPFDRLLVAQAVTERLTLVTADAKVALYDVPVIRC